MRSPDLIIFMVLSCSGDLLVLSVIQSNASFLIPEKTFLLSILSPRLDTKW